VPLRPRPRPRDHDVSVGPRGGNAAHAPKQGTTSAQVLADRPRQEPFEPSLQATVDLEVHVADVALYGPVWTAGSIEHHKNGTTRYETNDTRSPWPLHWPAPCDQPLAVVVAVPARDAQTKSGTKMDEGPSAPALEPS